MVARRRSGFLLCPAQDVRNQPDHLAPDFARAHRQLDAGLEHGHVRRRGSRTRFVAFSAEDVLMRLLLLAVFATLAWAQPHVDNVLVRMVPPGTTALVGAQIQALIATPIYRSLMDKQATAMFDKFAAETGFDPRRDVREILFATMPSGGVLLARGKF